MKILVGLSGGVDSAVTAALLQQQGHEVVGATMSIWREGKYTGGDRDACFGPGERHDIEAAERVCRLLGIPFTVVDCADAYEAAVLDNFRREYLRGRTPNPCVRCNSLLKFGLLPRLARASGLEHDRFATGHYVRVAPEAGRMQLRVARDASKDQSYFLYRLRQDQLRTILTPLGDFEKSEVRNMARAFGLDCHDKPDSQDFYSGDHRELLGIPDRPGKIVHLSGQCLGSHQGCWNFTVGQRKGLGISHPDPLYVVEINPQRNEVVVGGLDAATGCELTAEAVNWVSIPPPDVPFSARIKVRSSGRPVPCRVSPLGRDGFHAAFPDGIFGIAAGQSAVLYRGDVVLGGGVIVAGGGEGGERQGGKGAGEMDEFHQPTCKEPR